VEWIYITAVISVLIGGVAVSLGCMFFGIFTGFLTMVAAVLIPGFFYLGYTEAVQWTKGEIKRDISKDEFIKNDEFIGTNLKGYQLLKSFSSTMSITTRSKNSSTTNYYTAVPFVHKSYNSSDPVVFWCVYSSVGGSFIKEIQDFSEADEKIVLKSKSLDADKYYKSIKISLKKYSIESEENPVLIYLINDPEKYIERKIGELNILLITLNSAFIFITLILFLLCLKKNFNK